MNNITCIHIKYPIICKDILSKTMANMMRLGFSLARNPLAVSVSIRSMATGPTQWPPSFARGKETPKFTSTQVDGYEIRQYEPSKWVGTTIYSADRIKAFRLGAQKIANYGMKGENATETQMMLTLPLVTKVVPGQGPDSNSMHTVLYFVPSHLQENTPEPTNKTLSIINLPAMTAYVKSFGGFENEKKEQENTKALIAKLERDGKDYVKDYIFIAGYDPPHKFFGRHNEVWVLAEDIYK